MDKFQLEECLQEQKKYYIQHPDSEALKKVISEADYDFEDPLQNTETLEEFSVDEFSDKEKNKFLIYFRYIYNTKEFKKENKNQIDLKEFYEMAKRKKFIINYNNPLKV